MSPSVYTLLIVESPVLAGIIQRISPPSVYVVATGGFCWKPGFDSKTSKLKATADPKKQNIRDELKEQAQWANNVVIATDLDPAGDFIAWSIYRFLKKPGIKRTTIKNLSKSGVETMVNEARETDFSRLEYRLKNRFLILDEWKKTSQLPEFDLAGLIASFGHKNKFSHFKDEHGRLFASSDPVQFGFDEWLTIHRDTTEPAFRQCQPLSTPNLLEMAVNGTVAGRYSEAQELLQALFQTRLQFSGESLISYPRSNARAFYSETWARLRRQYLTFGSQNQLKPVFMQETAEPDTPHESIHPLSLDLTPDRVKGELPENLAGLYRLIYNHTVRGISIPARLSQTYLHNFYPGVHFYPADATNKTKDTSVAVSPCFTVADLCEKLSRAGITGAGTIGKKLDKWIAKGWITINHGVVSPGNPVIKKLDNAGKYEEKFSQMQQLSEQPGLSPATVRKVLTS